MGIENTRFEIYFTFSLDSNIEETLILTEVIR